MAYGADAILKEGRTLEHVFLIGVGTFQPQSGSGIITKKNVEDVVYAINRRIEVNVPVTLQYNHNEEMKTINVGIIRNAVLEGNQAFADLMILQDASADLDGNGSKILATKDQMADSILTNGMKLSIEAWRDVKAPAYYGERVVSLDPTAFAILPPGTLPAVPQYKLSANQTEKGELLVLSTQLIMADNGKDVNMSLEEAMTKIAELEAKNIELQKKLDALVKDAPDEEEASTKVEVDTLKDKLATAETKVAELERDKEEIEKAAMTQRATELQDTVKAKLVVGERSKLDTEMAKIDSPSERMAILGHIDRFLPKLEADKEVLNSGVHDDTDKSEQSKKVEAAVKMARDENITFVDAYAKLIERG